MNFLGSLPGTEALFANLSAAGAAAAAAAASGTNFADGSLTFQDKRNRNPNWTDHEIVRFLEMLQEDDTVKDLVANRNKKVFCLIAQRMCAEGAEKTWDQCRIKLKNLKSQYRYVKERIPTIDTLDLEDDDVVRQLIGECQGRGISPSSIKHLRFLLRFLNKQKDFGKVTDGQRQDPRFYNAQGTPQGKYHPESMNQAAAPLAAELFNKSMMTSTGPSATSKKNGEGGAVSPPTSPFPGLKLVNDATAVKKEGDPLTLGASLNGSSGGVSQEGYKFLEHFNREMLDQFMEHQRRTQASFTRWEQERWRQERESMERWRQEARDHERQLFGMFCTAMSKCNAAITAVLKAKATAAGQPAAAAGVKRKASAGPAVVKAKKAKDGEGDDISEEGVEDVGDDDDEEGEGSEDETYQLQSEIQNMVQVNMEEEDMDDDEADDDDSKGAADDEPASS